MPAVSISDGAEGSFQLSFSMIIRLKHARWFHSVVVAHSVASAAPSIS